MPALLSLTAEQRLAVECAAPWVRVQAGPGSGKTSVLAARIAHLIDCGVAPDQILALVFTRAACAELKSRLEDAGQLVDVQTFHSFAARRVVPAGSRVATESEAEALLRSLYEGGSKLGPRHRPSIRTIERELLEYEACLDVEHPSVIRVLQSRATAAHLVPTWDLLPHVVELDLPKVAHVLVDESQDCTLGEAMLAEKLAGESLFTVGDPRQAIMGFRLGSPKSWRSTLRQFETIELPQTFRFGPRIAEVANGIAAQFGGAPIVGGDVEDVVGFARSIDEALAIGGETAILCRTHRECELIAQAHPRCMHVRRDPLDIFGSDGDRFTEPLSRGRVPVSTIHGAKGREVDHVVLAVDIDAQCSEEWQRANYVAATRARRRLTLVEPVEVRG